MTNPTANVRLQRRRKMANTVARLGDLSSVRSCLALDASSPSPADVISALAQHATRAIAEVPIDTPPNRTAETVLACVPSLLQIQSVMVPGNADRWVNVQLSAPVSTFIQEQLAGGFRDLVIAAPELGVAIAVWDEEHSTEVTMLPFEAAATPGT